MEVNKELINLTGQSRLIQNKIYECEIKSLDSELEEINISKSIIKSGTKERIELLIKEKELLLKKDLLVKVYTDHLQKFINENS